MKHNFVIYEPGEPGPPGEPEELRSRWRADYLTPTGGHVHVSGPDPSSVMTSIAADLTDWRQAAADGTSGNRIVPSREELIQFFVDHELPDVV